MRRGQCYIDQKEYGEAVTDFCKTCEINSGKGKLHAEFNTNYAWIKYTSLLIFYTVRFTERSRRTIKYN